MRKKPDIDQALPILPPPAALSWDLFTTSGNIGYYLLYRDLLDDDPEHLLD